MLKNNKLWTLFLIFVVVSAGFVWNQKKKKSVQEKFKAVSVEQGAIAVTIAATGIVQPQNRLEVKPPIAGRIEEILVHEGERVKKGQILAWLSSTERAALLDAARAQGSQEAAHWEKVYKPTPLVSPMNGILIARNMEPGQTVSAQDVPLVMSDRLIVKAQVDETDIGRLKLGQKTEIVLDAYPSDKIRGEVNQIAFEAKTVNNVTIYETDVLPEDAPAFMRSGMTANVTFMILRKENILVIPSAAVREKEAEARVFIPSGKETKNGKPQSKTVKIGISDGKKVEIVEGLAEGETILVPETRWQRGNGREGGSGGNPLMPFGRRQASGRK